MAAPLPRNATHRPASGTIDTLKTGALDDLAVFVAVAERSSFVAASKRLAMPTSSVSRAVARLEELLGVQLLRRTSRKVVVTEEGRQLLLASSPHVEGLAEAIASTADRHSEPSGLVRATAPTYTGATRVARALAAFAEAHPQITIELDASNRVHDLLHDGFDFAIRAGGGTNAEFVARRLWQGRFGLFAARDFVRKVLKGKRTLSRETIERGPCVVMRRATVWRFRDAKGRVIEVSPQPRFAVNDPRAGVEVAMRGLGIVLAPLDAMATNRALVQLHPDFGDPEPIELFIVYPTRRLLPRRVRLAIDWLLSWKDPT